MMAPLRIENNENRIVGEDWETYCRQPQEADADSAEVVAPAPWVDLVRQIGDDARWVMSFFRRTPPGGPGDPAAGNADGGTSESNGDPQEQGKSPDEDGASATEDSLLVDADRQEAHLQHELVTLQERFEQRKQDRAERIAQRAEQRQKRREARITRSRIASLDAEATDHSTDDGTEPMQDGAETVRTPQPVRDLPVLPYTLDQPYRLPDLSMLTDIDVAAYVPAEEIERQRDILQRTFDSFRIDARVKDAVVGPRVTLFKIDPAVGVRVESIARIGNNIAMELEAISIRILAPVPGRPYVGVQVPNTRGATVGLRGILAEGGEKGGVLPLALGRNIQNDPVFLDLARAPHLLIAGATGSGKSVCLNSLLMSLLIRFSPAELRLILIDPKVVEFACYEKLPHLLAPVINDVDKVVAALYWLTEEMQRRYELLGRARTRNLESYNARDRGDDPAPAENEAPLPETLPFIVLVIDELADIMMTARTDVETAIARLAQKSRAVGIHLILATQRPSVNIITGVIKSNLPTRIAFQVSSQIDARTILDRKGAEALLGRGDMLFAPPGAGSTERLQSPMVLDDDIERIVAYIAEQAEPKFELDILHPRSTPGAAGAPAADEDNELLNEARQIVVQERRASTSYLQRRLRIGYNRAAELIEQLEDQGVVGPSLGSKPREILVDNP